ncbi:arsenosugar biosynthesis radical SAM protein ArsS [Salibacteraceae bacterium]|nr:arsenosugar biosynthesis radical SAM protein ArsS [Salibacteraceae bacterium]MDA9267775.1 arsenosugar biosynthesis radical SAM protein ArsS [Salibacteraceae bacterium]MDB9708528.1 arsenosugar biosynthesis radical SAM protein ArsS [Salibacteraceae bacterium]MDC1304134.1 arsenosugar biosynthesis radical SAM protein ArsS [Salibacteraceae bacterium]
MALTKTLQSRSSDLSKPESQVEFLSSGIFSDGKAPIFRNLLDDHSSFPLKPNTLEVLQVNLGYMCNQTCKHCHVDAGPDRTEIMTKQTMQSCIDVIKSNNIETIDLTGGAPEMNPNFKWFVEHARPYVNEIIVRSNLTIIEANKTYNELPVFIAKNKIRLVSSLPFYNADKTDRQRGKGVFDKSINALRKLNNLGYGKPESGLTIDLVYNPTGAFLPAPQLSLEKEFKKVLKEEFDICFNQLFCITNLPISRFLDYLIQTENYEDYMFKLIESFNPEALDGVMCKSTLSVGWNGTLYDCDFNQMLDLKIDPNSPQSISSFNIDTLKNRVINTSQHCFGCTAGAGSSCQGSLV